MKLWRGAAIAAVTGAVAIGAWGGLFAHERWGEERKAEDQIDAIFADLVKPGSPGCALGVYRDSRIVYSKGYGLANIEESVPISPKSVFDIGSTSKQFTAASIVLLEKQGKLSVNDDVRKYIPELPDYGPGKKVTIVQMLNHTSGLRDYLVLFDLAGVNIDSVTTDDDALTLIARQKSLNFVPGSEYLYSNSGFFLLSVIVKRVSGQTLREFASANIFGPLGMTHTRYRDSHTELVADRAMAYDPNEKKGGFTMNISYFEQTGDGAVHTSVEDLQKWDENFYSAQVGGKEFLTELQEPGKFNDGRKSTYAKGLAVSKYRGLRTVRHGGSWGGYRAELLRFPDQHFSVACLCNVANADPSKRANLVADLYLEKLMTAKEAKKDKNEDDDEVKNESKGSGLPADQLHVFAGSYWSEELGVFYQLGVKDGSLKVVGIADKAGIPRANNFSKSEIRMTGKDKFNVGTGQTTLTFGRDPAGKVNGFVVDAGRTTGIHFARAAESFRTGTAN
jgi:CubicO group peptidase (beta-lactamase class C family)